MDSPLKEAMISMSTPEVTVLLPVYNGEKFIHRSVESILNQTFTNFTFLIIDDGSTDSTKEILLQYEKKDSRINLVSRPNKGLIATLNEGLRIADTKFIARMDADDISFPDRLKLQIDFMKENSEISVCGSALKIIETGEIKIYFSNSQDLKAISLFQCPVAHPTVMFKRDDVLSVGGYSPAAIYAEDYDLWDRMIYNGFRFCNIDKITLYYRLNLDQDRFLYHAKMADTTSKIHKRILNRIGIQPTKHDLLLHKLCTNTYLEPQFKINQIKNWLKKINLSNIKYKYIEEHSLEKVSEHIIKKITCLKIHENPQKWLRRNLYHTLYSTIPIFGKYNTHIIASTELLWSRIKKYI